jgi:hypothetical protein
MFGAIKNAVLAVRAPRLHDLALGAVSNKRYEQAQSLLRNVYEFVDCQGPSPNVPYFVNILYGLVAYRLGDIGLCVNAIKTALLQLG